MDIPVGDESLNRTIVELKHLQCYLLTSEHGKLESNHRGIETASAESLDLPIMSLNRTIVELKLDFDHYFGVAETMLESNHRGIETMSELGRATADLMLESNHRGIETCKRQALR